jgi:hypothetical protein
MQACLPDFSYLASAATANQYILSKLPEAANHKYDLFSQYACGPVQSVGSGIHLLRYFGRKKPGCNTKAPANMV